MKQRSAGKPDIELGKRIRLRRVEQKISQAELGDKLGVSFQQVQKYEKGANRIGASRLQSIASALSVPIAFFFEGLSSSERADTVVADDDTARFVTSLEGRELNRAFARISDQKVRRRVIELVRSLAGDTD